MGKRIAAIIGVVLLLGMYIATGIVAVVAPEGSTNMIMGCVAMTIVVPIVLWFYMMLYKAAHKNDDENITLSEMRKINKRLKNGEDANKIAEEIDQKYNNK